MPRACSSKMCASAKGQMLPPRPSISNGICCSPGWSSCVPGRRPISSSVPSFYRQPHPKHFLGIIDCCASSGRQAFSCSVHLLAAHGSICDLIGGLKTPGCFIIVRQRDCQGIKGCSQWLYELFFLISVYKRPLDRDKSQPAFNLSHRTKA